MTWWHIGGAIYLSGFVFHAWLGWRELHSDVTRLEYVIGTAKLIVWPVIPLEILYRAYKENLS